MLVPILFLLMAAPFWESKPPAEWTDEELDQLLFHSPWSRLEAPKGGDPEARIQVEATHFFLATASPMRQAEEERRRRAPSTGSAAEAPALTEYQEFLEDNPGRYIVLAVRQRRPRFLERAKEVQRMEEKCVLRVGKRRHRLVGHFPPTPGDPYLRLVFPRELQATDESLVFNLYVPGVPNPFRKVSFELERLRYREEPDL